MNRHLLYALIIAALSAPGTGPTALAKTSPPRGERYEDASDHVFLDGEITSILVGWGEGELDEVKRQGKKFADTWRNMGLPQGGEEFKGFNHFDGDSAFAEPSSPIVGMALAQMGLA